MCILFRVLRGNIALQVLSIIFKWRLFSNQFKLYEKSRGEEFANV